MDISKLLLTPQPPYREEGGLSDIGSAKYNKRELERRWEALDTIYVELPPQPVTFTPVYQDPPCEYTLQELRELAERMLSKF